MARGEMTKLWTKTPANVHGSAKFNQAMDKTDLKRSWLEGKLASSLAKMPQNVNGNGFG